MTHRGRDSPWKRGQRSRLDSDLQGRDSPCNTHPYLREIDNVPARKIFAVQKKRALETRLRPARERLAVKHLGSYVSGDSERSSEEEIRREEYESARD